MSDKNRDEKKRWRNKTLAFRVSPEEYDKIAMMANTSGMSKQSYLIKRALCEDIIVNPNIRVKKFLSQYLVELTIELKRLERIEQTSDVLENIAYLLQLIKKLDNNFTTVDTYKFTVNADFSEKNNTKITKENKICLK